MTKPKMKILFATAFTAFAMEAAAGEAPATAPSEAKASSANCEDIKSSIDAKIKAKGVKAFTLQIVGKDEVKDAKVVGSCEAGSKKITYKRG